MSTAISTDLSTAVNGTFTNEPGRVLGAALSPAGLSVRAACRKLARLAIQGARKSSQPAAQAPVSPSLAAGLPARWPFPPAPSADTLQSPAARPASPVGGLRAGKPRAAEERGLDAAAVQPVSQGLTTRQIVADIAMVLAWGAMIPALMWLGAAAGF